MSHLRWSRSLLGVAALSLAASLLLTGEREPMGRAAAPPPGVKGLPSDLALVPGECLGVVTFRVADLLADPVAAGLSNFFAEDLLATKVILVPAARVAQLTVIFR